MVYHVHRKEYVYLVIKVLATLAVAYGFVLAVNAQTKVSATAISVASYVVGFMLLVWIRSGLFVGYIKGSCVQVGPEQFPDIYAVLCSHSAQLGLKKVPSLFIMQAGGILNALALRFVGSNYVVIYSDVLESAYEEGMDAVSFIIGHELGHIKRMHMTMNTLLFPSCFVPFLQSAYSRACEYTCDGIGYGLSQGGAVKGLCILSVGSTLYRRVNIRKYIENSAVGGGFWGWAAEVISSHPFLPKRIANVAEIHKRRT